MGLSGIFKEKGYQREIEQLNAKINSLKNELSQKTL